MTSQPHDRLDPHDAFDAINREVRRAVAEVARDHDLDLSAYYNEIDPCSGPYSKRR